jgi:hypothetical protein
MNFIYWWTRYCSCTVLGGVVTPHSFHTDLWKSVVLDKKMASIKPDRRACFCRQGERHSQLCNLASDSLKKWNFDLTSFLPFYNFAKLLDDAIVWKQAFTIPIATTWKEGKSFWFFKRRNDLCRSAHTFCPAKQSLRKVRGAGNVT